MHKTLQFVDLNFLAPGFFMHRFSDILRITASTNAVMDLNGCEEMTMRTCFLNWTKIVPAEKNTE